MFEIVYEEMICYELAKRNIPFKRPYGFRVFHENRDMGIGFRADIVVADKVILELKSVEKLHEVYYKQVVTYLRTTGLKPGLRINFKVPLIKDGLHRLVNNL